MGLANAVGPGKPDGRGNGGHVDQGRLMTDLEMMQGTWREVFHQRDGGTERFDEEHGWQPVTVIHEQTFTVTIADGSVVLVGTFELFDTQTPTAIDWHDVSGPYASDHLIQAIYEVTETSFVFCAAYNGGTRPTALRAGLGQVLRRMERVSDAEV
jgi:uncharacterized protein (TIGR03067 family)